MKQTVPGRIHKFGQHLDVISAVLFPLVAWVVDLDTSKPAIKDWPDFAKNLIQSTQSGFLWFACAIAFASIVGIAARKTGHHWVWGTLKYVLNEFRKKAYPNHQTDRNANHRVTLFKRCKWVLRSETLRRGRRPWGGWLVPILRSGHKSLETKALFYAPDGADSEGIAGYAWDSQRQISVPNLPSLTGTSSTTQRQKYADRTFCHIDMVNEMLHKGKSPPRSIGAIPVFANGEIWGVLVLDSQAADGVTDALLDNFSLTVSVIGKLLEKAK